MSLEFRGVTAGYGGTTVLRDVSLTVPAGKVVALLGPNGAGKTTLLRVGSGLLAAQSGELLLDGQDVTGATPHELVHRGICHIPEGRGIFPSLSVQENLRLFARGDGDLERVFDAFPALAECRQQLAGTMSGGQQQIIALARTYVTSPRFVLVDEASMGLAPLIVEEIFGFLRVLANEGVALLIVEQYVQQALGMADFVYILRKGRLAFAGEPAELDADTLTEQYLGTGTGSALVV